MKDVMKREKGKYSETTKKTVEGVEYTKIETIIVGRDFEIMNFQNEYSPGIKFPKTWETI